MPYSTGNPIRLIGGRLSLDFVNTADWSAHGSVRDEKIETEADLALWLTATGLKSTASRVDIPALHMFRRDLRQLFFHNGDPQVLNAVQDIRISANSMSDQIIADQSLTALLAVSAISVLTDPREIQRLKQCPGDDCGWLFIDETRNARRRWCCMETCGNRAKAARHYARSKSDGSTSASPPQS